MSIKTQKIKDDKIISKKKIIFRRIKSVLFEGFDFF